MTVRDFILRFQSLFGLLAIFTLSVILDRDLKAAENIRERRAHVIELVKTGIRATDR